MKRSESLQMRTSAGSLMLLEGMVAIPLIISLLAVVMGNSTMWPPTVLLMLTAALLLLWLKSFRVEIADGVLHYHSLFGGSRRIELHQIQRAAFEVGSVKYSDRFRPPMRLAIVPVPESAVRPFDINLKLLRQSDVRRLLAIVAASASDDDTCAEARTEAHPS